ncbi:MAG TPA: phytoene/squalene synthase family protein [Methylocella sp.]|nr:phytoene/squalene synthase family protein [Methylocella sp.]
MSRIANYAYCEDLLRRDDRDRWLSSLFVPQAMRPHVHALYAFSLEIARVREVTSEPLLGEIRFQWWRDAINGQDQTGAAANPVSAALLDTLTCFGLPKAPLLELIEARLQDLYNEPIERTIALETYAEATTATLFRLAMQILEPQEAVAGLSLARHAGIAYSLTGLLRALPWHCARGQLFVPAEIFRKAGLDARVFLEGRNAPTVQGALAELRALARTHLETFHSLLPGLSPRCRPALLPACLCEPYLRQMEKSGYDPFKSVIELAQWRRQWILWRTARRWG